MSWLRRIQSSAAVETLASMAQRGGRVSARGAAGSSTLVVAVALHQRSGRPVHYVCAHADEVDQVVAECAALGISALGLPALETLGNDGSAGLDLVADRLRALARLASGDQVPMLVSSIASLMQPMAAAQASEDLFRIVRKGTTLPRDSIVSWLGRAGYARVTAVESPGEFAVRGGILDVFPAGALVAVRIDCFGDEVDSIHEIDLASQASDRAVPDVALVAMDEDRLLHPSGGVEPGALLGRDAIGVIAELGELTEQSRSYWERVSGSDGIRSGQEVLRSLASGLHALVDIGAYSGLASGADVLDLPVQPAPALSDRPELALREWMEEASRADAVLWTDSEGESKRVAELASETRSAAGADAGALAPALVMETRLMRGGFTWADGVRPLLCLTGHELLNRFGRIERRRQRGGALGGSRRSAREAFMHFEAGDYVVHRDHGIGRYTGLRELGEREAGAAGGIGGEREFMGIEYAENSSLFVPLSKAVLVQRYIGAGAARPKLSTMGGRRWKGQKAQVAEAVKDMAAELLRVQAVRESTTGIAFPADTEWQRRFEAEFPFEETPDQAQAIDCTKRDMERARPMDRLICGDVGFGKTEVAIRAAFKCCEAGRQVAILVPTTVLAEQHTRTFTSRFKAYPFRVESISRFKSDREVREVLDALAAGEVDVLVGTHRLLSADVRFHDLGLVVVDEEQRFGVEHKQRLLELRLTADVLTLSATPIPRTLHMSMLGLRDISSLTTPPLDRRPIVTEVIPWQRDRITHAIERELAREGQVYFVHNRVYDIDDVAAEVQTMAPGARIVVGHGQMEDGELERVMVQFLSRRADILVSTTIIESGLDIPTANTIIIDQAHLFGLSELHQLRGRVGRSRHRAYCYLLFDPSRPVTAEALRRLRAIEDFSMLGAGFRIAVRDLEIRGAGNLLGSEQSGHIAAVGYEMYCQLLEEAVHRLRHEPTKSVVDTHVELGAIGNLPAGYIPSERRRIEAWRRIGAAQSVEELDAIFADLASAYGSAPASAQLLQGFATIRLAATIEGVRMLVRRGPDLVFRTARPDEVDRLLRRERGTRRRVASVDGSTDVDVHWRPPEGRLEPGTLVPLLERLYRSKFPSGNGRGTTGSVQ